MFIIVFREERGYKKKIYKLTNYQYVCISLKDINMLYFGVNNTL